MKRLLLIAIALPMLTGCSILPHLSEINWRLDQMERNGKVTANGLEDLAKLSENGFEGLRDADIETKAAFTDKIIETRDAAVAVGEHAKGLGEDLEDTKWQGAGALGLLLLLRLGGRAIPGPAGAALQALGGLVASNGGRRREPEE